MRLVIIGIIWYTQNMTKDNKKEVYWRCKKCGDEIYWNTHKKMVMCKCGALGVDGCEFYVRLTGDEKDREEIKRVKKHG